MNRWFRPAKRRAVAVCTAGVPLLLILFASHTQPKVIVLGVDGMDPDFVERHWDALPNLNALRTRGSFQRLATTDPPQSPVAWTTFMTGLSPDKHGVYDFVLRDPNTLAPYSSLGRTVEPEHALLIGPYRIPLERATVVSSRRGAAFWQLLADRGIPVTVIKCPGDYPPISAGHELSGMGTPDLRGSLGTFTYYTDEPGETRREVDGGDIKHVEINGGRAHLRLTGPPNSLRRDEQTATTELVVDMDPERRLARFEFGQQAIILKEGEWSAWLPVTFSLIPHLATIEGMVRIYLKQLHPNLEIYVTPVNASPLDAPLPISYPVGWSKTVASAIGPYFTLGIPEDTAALRNGVLNMQEFEQESGFVLAEEQKLLRYALQQYDGGFLFFYFSSIDQSSHIYWGENEPALLKVYRAIDASVGEVMKRQPGARLMVMSDHGFTSFNRAVHLNTWLYENGYLALNGQPGPDASLRNVDWTRTRAYAIGLNALYLNLAGRESHGIVRTGSEAHSVEDELRSKLLAWRDPITGKAPVESVDATHPAPENAKPAPDLIVGYGRGYRASWQTALGGVPDAILSDNDEPWKGDHCVNPADVPGLLFTSEKTPLANPRLEDLSVMILRIFGINGGKRNN